MNIHLGYEVGTGKAVEIPLRHLAVTGQTQLSGKTTTLEALISRSGLRAVAFVTKRAEGGFQNARTIPPYFRERADWQFVSSVMEAALREKVKFERGAIIRACKGAHTLGEVRRNVQSRMEKARGLDAEILERLNAYLDLVIPQIDRLPYSKSLTLEPGINVMDLQEYTMELQSLVIRSVLEAVYSRERDVITIIPEAWEFIPQQRGSPVLLACEELIRKGGGIKNFVWIDSQDIAGVHKNVLRSVGVWILGVQREVHEVKRVLDHIYGSPKPKPADIMGLGLGEFFACFDKTMVKVYVQPAWGSNAQARAVSTGDMGYEEVRELAQRQTKKTEDAVYKEKYEGERRARELVEKQLSKTQDTLLEVQGQLKRLQNEKRHAVRSEDRPVAPDASAPNKNSSSPAPDSRLPTPSDSNGFYAAFKRRLLADPQVLDVLAERPEIEVRLIRPTVQLDGGTLRGKLALLISEGWFESPRNGNAAYSELRGRRGFPTAKPNVYRELDKLTEMGFLVKEAGGYQAVEGMKCRIVES